MKNALIGGNETINKILTLRKFVFFPVLKIYI